jgi:tRNA-guanine family transglycosylase
MSNITLQLWLSNPLKGIPKPWLYFPIDGLMVNAYEILGKTNTIGKIIENGIHDYLKIKSEVMMDSGGYQFMKQEIMDVDPLTILDLYEKSSPDYCVVLDHPILPNLSSKEIRNRQNRTLKNTQIMLENRTTFNPTLLPAIHGHNLKFIEWFLEKLEEINDFDYFGLGSLVPSVFNSKGIGGIYNVLEILHYVREYLGKEKKIHVFGIGSTSTMHLMYYAGANSVDSASWRVKAAYGAIQLPGTGDRYITPRERNKKYRDLDDSDKQLLEECKCPVCREGNQESLRKSFRKRALHNAWVYQKEVEKARDLIKKHEYSEYVHEVLGNSRLFSNVIKYYENELLK